MACTVHCTVCTAPNTYSVHCTPNNYIGVELMSLLINDQMYGSGGCTQLTHCKPVGTKCMSVCHHTYLHRILVRDSFRIKQFEFSSTFQAYLGLSTIHSSEILSSSKHDPLKICLVALYQIPCIALQTFHIFQSRRIL